MDEMTIVKCNKKYNLTYVDRWSQFMNPLKVKYDKFGDITMKFKNVLLSDVEPRQDCKTTRHHPVLYIYIYMTPFAKQIV